MNYSWVLKTMYHWLQGTGSGGGDGGDDLAFPARATFTSKVSQPGRRNSKFRGV